MLKIESFTTLDFLKGKQLGEATCLTDSGLLFVTACFILNLLNMTHFAQECS